MVTSVTADLSMATGEPSTSPSVFNSSLFQLDSDPEAQQPSSSSSHSPSRASQEIRDSERAPSRFIRKLYKLLNDDNYSTTICWCETGDAFVVKDLDKFTRSILPRTFMHSNFASFVRQLSDHEFRRVKSTNENVFDGHDWTFRHPHFYRDGRSALASIRRNVPVRATSPSYRADLMQALQEQYACMRRQHAETTAHIQHLKDRIDALLGTMASLERMREEQEDVMQRLVQYSTDAQPGGGNEEVEFF